MHTLHIQHTRCNGERKEAALYWSDKFPFGWHITLHWMMRNCYILLILQNKAQQRLVYFLVIHIFHQFIRLWPFLFYLVRHANTGPHTLVTCPITLLIERERERELSSLTSRVVLYRHKRCHIQETDRISNGCVFIATSSLFFFLLKNDFVVIFRFSSALDV
jgi:hypothetical protein